MDKNKILNEEDIKTLQMYFKQQHCITVEQALYLKFPKIKLSKVEADGEMINIQFEDDGIHTKEMVTDFLEQVKKESEKFRL